jgi:hypothetical protein
MSEPIINVTAQGNRLNEAAAIALAQEHGVVDPSGQQVVNYSHALFDAIEFQEGQQRRARHHERTRSGPACPASDRQSGCRGLQVHGDAERRWQADPRCHEGVSLRQPAGWLLCRYPITLGHKRWQPQEKS